MWSFKRINIESTSQKPLVCVNHLALYDQYGSMAYGVILHILPDPTLAQAVLIDLFRSPQLKSYTKAPTAGEIIRLARVKALAARPILTNPAQESVPLPTENDTTNTAKLVFTLSFCQGYTVEEIAEKLQLSSRSVLKAFHTYFNYLRSS